MENKRCEHCGGIMVSYRWEDQCESFVHAIRQEADACLSKRLDECINMQKTLETD